MKKTHNALSFCLIAGTSLVLAGDSVVSRLTKECNQLEQEIVQLRNTIRELDEYIQTFDPELLPKECYESNLRIKMASMRALSSEEKELEYKEQTLKCKAQTITILALKKDIDDIGAELSEIQQRLSKNHSYEHHELPLDSSYIVHSIHIGQETLPDIYAFNKKSDELEHKKKMLHELIDTL